MQSQFVDPERLLFVMTALAIVFSPFTSINLVWFFSASDVFLTLAVAALLYRFSESNYRIQLPRQTATVLVAAFLLLLLELFLVSRAARPVVALQWARTRAGSVLLFFVVIVGVESHQKTHIILRLLTVSIAVLATMTLLHSFGIIAFGDHVIKSRAVLGYRIPFRRTLGLEMDYGNYGMYMVLGSSYVLYETIKNQNYIALGALPIMSFSVFVSQSRSSWAAMLVVFGTFAAYLLYTKVKRKSRSVLYFVAAVVGTISIWGLIWISHLLIRINPLTLRSRIHAITEGISIWSSSPIFGIGRYTYFFQHGGEVLHNGFLNILVAFGITGLIIFGYIYFGTIVVLCQKWYNKSNRFFTIFLTSSLGGITIELMFFDGSYTKILWFVLALAYASHYNKIVMCSSDGNSSQVQD